MDPQESPAIRILNKIEEELPDDSQRLQNYVAALRDEIGKLGKEDAAREQLLAEYEEAYRKLTAPANRLGIFLKHLDNGLVLVALGDTEYVAEVDPKVDDDDLKTGVRVRLNEAYAVIGILDVPMGGNILKVAETLPDGRLRIGSDPQNQQGRLVGRASDLDDIPIKKGDEVRLDATGRLAVEHFAHQETQDYFMEKISQIPWEKVGGQEEAISLIRETIEQPLLHPELYAKFEKQPVKGILLYGPPGCGKTLIGKATAYNLAKEYSDRVGHEVKEYFMHISGPKILNMWLGETERIVREIFETARSKAKEGRLVVIFMDEAESVLRTRSSGRWMNISNTVVPQFCAELDGLVSLQNVVLILTSNRPDYIDPAVLRPERIDRKVKVNRPDRESSREILSIYLNPNLPIDPALVAEFDHEPSCARKELIESTIAQLWQTSPKTEFLKVFYRSGNSDTLHWRDLVSGALLKSIVDRAKDTAIRRAIAEPTVEHGISREDMVTALEAEYRENEIFPKSDTMEDWLKLLDVEPDSVVTVKPIRPSKGEDFIRKNVI